MSRLARAGAILALVIAASSAPLAPAGPVGPVGPASVAAAAPRPLTSSQLSKRLTHEVYGYLPWWELNAATIAWLRPDLLSTISLFSFRYAADGTIPRSSTTDRLLGPLGQDVIRRAHTRGVRVELAFSFAQTPEPNDAFFADTAARKQAVASTLALLTQTGADGVNLDVERLHNSSFAGYGSYVKQLRTAIRTKNPIGRVTVATNANVSGARMAAAALSAGGDRAFMMGYSYRSSGSNPTGSVSPMDRFGSGLDIVQSLALYRTEKVPLGKVLLGLPYYGLSVPTVDGSLHSARRYSIPSGARPCSSWNPSFPTFFVRDRGLMPRSSTIGFDWGEVTAWAAYRDPASGVWCETYFETQKSLTNKYGVAIRSDLGGVGLWALGYERDKPSYWNALRNVFARS